MKGEAITAAHELSPLITRLRNDTESSRCIAQPIVGRLRETRLCRMAVARELQGLELPTAEALEVYEALAGAEASVAWIVWNNSLPCFFGRFLDSAARREIFADPKWLYASSTRPTGRAAIEGDGYRINGRWSLVSGCELAEWIAFVCLVEENGELRMVDTGRTGDAVRVPAAKRLRNSRYVAQRWPARDGQPRRRRQGQTGSASVDRFTRRCEQARCADRPGSDHLHDGCGIWGAGARNRPVGDRHTRRAHENQGQSGSGTCSG